MLQEITKNEGTTKRPPIVVVMGHVDHGKSTLLDYVRKSHIVEGETGGITQHIGAYETTHESEGVKQRITFIDTPGHEAFTKMRSRGATVADIAILVVAANDGVKAQTKEAIDTILATGIPFVVAINKIDLEGANEDRVKQELSEYGVFVEGYGGDVTSAPISAKTGSGVDELLSLVLLLADMADLKGDASKMAEGVVVESHLDKRSGASATIIITDGTISKPCCLLSGGEIASLRGMQTSAGEEVREANFSSPLLTTGWSAPPPVGATFQCYSLKREAEVARDEMVTNIKTGKVAEDERAVMVIVIKADVAGTLEAIVNKLTALDNEKLRVKIVGSGLGPVSENDIRMAGCGENKALVLAFNVGVDRVARDLSDSLSVEIHEFDIIYKLLEFVDERFLRSIPTEMVEEVQGKARVLRIFSATRAKQVLGGSVLEGVLNKGARLRVMRNEHEIGRGKIVELQEQKIAVPKVEAGNQFGAMIESTIPLAERDIIECVVDVER
ncbi:MAG: translation initiation factor IF-2 [Candidatus Vogelbacteria bacterium CG10_big_fil_rev_8_21_14_0_10_45_14]|uniref:Translation initiation factor IF-2 n=1 Tax=Candidatus Vogelbacteria bacterium CG10_big_fil_rev_8_21_14_0_10_45_14 TaxID=1975042 RepID=A0A2H0RJP6_9BACT|nr:MAG: translation initiation factor IF-2 [Candidatus Vogelbacteria bacterium CG10_big_fil_rev_8_21_14_0_10_45_14]